MTYNTRKLIADAYALSGFVARGYQTITGEQEATGLTLFNGILAEKSFDTRLIPYFTSYTFNTVIGQQTYFVPNLLEAECLTFNIGSVRYTSKLINRGKYFGSARAESVQSLPVVGHIERTVGGANLFVYFLPAAVYSMTIWGKFGFTSVTLSTDLLTLYDLGYLMYLKHELAAAICEDGQQSLPQSVAAKLESMRLNAVDSSPMDVDIQCLSKFGRGNATIGWAWINFGPWV